MQTPASKRKKVLICITKSSWGGAQKYVFDIATHLPQDQFEVVVALGGKGLLYTKLVVSNIRVVELDGLQRDVSFTKDIYSFFDILKILKTEKPDILHVNSTKISGLAALAGRFVGIKNIVFTVHGWAFNEPRGFISKSIIKALYLVMLTLSHNVIAVSKKITEQVEGWPFTKRKMKIIHNGIASPNFFGKEDARKKLAELSDSSAKFFKNFSLNTVLWGGVGELHTIKGHVYAIQAMEKMILKKPDIDMRYIIIGSGEIQQKLQDEILARNLVGKVYLAGYVVDAARYIKAFDYYLFPSLSEGLPYALVEAGFAELPVIASNIGGIPEIIENGKEGLLIPSMHADAIYTALYSYIENPNTAKNHAENLHKKVVSEFSLEHMMSETVRVFDRG